MECGGEALFIFIVTFGAGAVAMLSCPDSLSQILFHCVGCMTSVLHCLHASRIPSLDLYPDNPLQIGSWISNLLVFLDLGNICCHNSRGTGSMRAQVVGIGEVELHLYVAAQDHDSHVKLQFQPPSNVRTLQKGGC